MCLITSENRIQFFLYVLFKMQHSLQTLLKILKENKKPYIQRTLANMKDAITKIYHSTNDITHSQWRDV